MKRLSLNHLALMLPLGLFGMNNCMNSTTLRKIIGRLPPTITMRQRSCDRSQKRCPFEWLEWPCTNGFWVRHRIG